MQSARRRPTQIAWIAPAPQRRGSVQLQMAEWEHMDAVAQMIRQTTGVYRPFLADNSTARQAGERWQKEQYAKREFIVAVDGNSLSACASMQVMGTSLYVGCLRDRDDGAERADDLLEYATSVARSRGLLDVILLAHPDGLWAQTKPRAFEPVMTDDASPAQWRGGCMKPYLEPGLVLFSRSLLPKAWTPHSLSTPNAAY